MGAVTPLAQELGVSDRTLRRAARDGSVRGRWSESGRLRLSASEQAYLIDGWPLLGTLRSLLRTERNVRMAVLFGSRARGDHRPDSDVDLLVVLRDGSPSRRLALVRRLETALGLAVEAVALDEAERSPILLVEAIEDGRPLVDRDGQWPRLRRREPALARAAADAREDLERDAREALVELAAGRG